MPAHQGLSALLLPDDLFCIKNTSQRDDWAVQNCTLFRTGGFGAVYAQADFFVEGRNSMRFPRSSACPSHSHPHWQRIESHSRGFLRSALQMAHDLIHMVLLHCESVTETALSDLLLCRLEPKRSFPVSIGGTEWGMAPRSRGTKVIASTGRVGKTKRPGLSLSHKAFSRSALPQVLLNHRIERHLFRVNGTEVPDDITLGPYDDCCNPGVCTQNLWPRGGACPFGSR